MKLFIIGNGFDRAHDLPTQYWDFRKYLEKNYSEFLSMFEENYDIYKGTNDEEKQSILWNELEKNLANINESVIIENAMNIEMGLEGGDFDVEDTLRDYFGQEFAYIKKLEIYLKQWVRTIRIRDVKPFTSKINNLHTDVFINFNYTSVLETAYKIEESNVIHIHGSLRTNSDNPILGHGNLNRIEDIKARKNQATIAFVDKEISICHVLQDYYQTTFKNVSNYMYKLNGLIMKKFDEIIVIGHSVSGVDLPYFGQIDKITSKKLNWKVYYYKECEKVNMKQALSSQGISEKRIEMFQTDEFYDLKNK